MRRDLPSLNAIRMFEAAARTESFTRAADELHVTQGAVSRQIALLEEQLGSSLFHRKGPKLALSEAGITYQGVVREALEIIRQGTAQIRRARQMDVVTVSILPSFASYWLIPRLPQFEKLHPEVTLRLEASYRMIDFTRESEVDCAIRYGRGQWSHVYAKQITRDELIPVCAPQLAETISSVRDLVGQRLLSELPDYDEWQRWFALFDIKRPTHNDLVYDDTSIQIRAAVSGHGVMLAREDFIKDYLASGGLVRLFPEAIVSDFQYYFVCSPQRLSNPAVGCLRDWLSNVENIQN